MDFAAKGGGVPSRDGRTNRALTHAERQSNFGRSGTRGPKGPKGAMPSNRETWVGLGILALAGVLLGISGLIIPAHGDAPRLAFALALLALVGLAIGVGLQPRAALVMRHILLWVAATMVAATGIGFHGELLSAVGLPAQFFAPVRSEAPEPQGTVTLRAEPGGHFLADTLVNGTFVRFLVDTGATDVALTHDDAMRLGLTVKDLDYSIEVRTANGPTRAAAVTLAEIAIGSLKIEHVSALVTEGALDTSLLGMSFLKRLSRVSVDSDRLVMHQ